MKRIMMNYNDLDIDITINKRITILKDLSGTGKTFLFSVLSSYFQDNAINFSLFDYRNMGFDYTMLKGVSSNKAFILMDNADLYMTKELWNFIESSNCYFIISLKSIIEINPNNADICFLRYDNNKIRMEHIR